MARSTIIKQLANNEISLEIALSHLLVIMSSLGVKELVSWCEHELNGYSQGDDVPSYRVLNEKKGQIIYSGLNGSFQVTNVPLPLYVFKDEELKKLGINVNQSIKSLEQLSDSDGKIGRDLTWFAPEVLERSGIQCIKICIEYSNFAILDILSAVRTTLLNTLLFLEKTFGTLDALDIDISKQSDADIEKIHTELHGLIFRNVGNGDK